MHAPTRIQRYRIARALTQARLATLSGVDQVTISEAERFGTATARTLLKLATALGEPDPTRLLERSWEHDLAAAAPASPGGVPAPPSMAERLRLAAARQEAEARAREPKEVREAREALHTAKVRLRDALERGQHRERLE